VDRDHAAHARELVTKVQGEGAPPAPQPQPPPAAESGSEPTAALDIDAAWKDIVAGYDEPAADGAPSWPSIEDAGGERPASPGMSLIKADHLRPIGLGPRDHTLAEAGDDDLGGEVEEGYEPPPPPPIPKPSGQAVLGALAIIIGLALFFRPSLLPIDTNGVLVLGVLGVLGGAGLLVHLLRDGLSGDDDDPDDGAVV
jgi:hypothetical protein